MQLLFLLQSFALGGAERQALRLGIALKNKGASVTFAAFSAGGPVEKICKLHQIPTIILPLPLLEKKQSFTFLTFIRQLRMVTPDIILGYCTLPNIMASLAFPFTQAKACIWGQRDAGLNNNIIASFPGIQKLPSTFVSNSMAGVTFLKTLKPTAPILHIQNCVFLDPAQKNIQEWRRHLNVSDDAQLLLMLANLHGNKAHDLLIEAWHIARKKPSFPQNAHLILAGRPGDRANHLYTLTKTLGLTTSVSFIGEVEDIGGLVAASDIGIFSSRLEGLPNGVLECMAGGLPIVALDIVGTREACGAIEENILISEHSPKALADGIIEMLTNKARQQKAGKRNRLYIAQNFSEERIVEQYQTIFNLLPDFRTANWHKVILSIFVILKNLALRAINKYFTCGSKNNPAQR